MARQKMTCSQPERDGIAGRPRLLDPLQIAGKRLDFHAPVVEMRRHGAVIAHPDLVESLIDSGLEVFERGALRVVAEGAGCMHVIVCQRQLPICSTRHGRDKFFFGFL